MVALVLVEVVVVVVVVAVEVAIVVVLLAVVAAVQLNKCRDMMPSSFVPKSTILYYSCHPKSYPYP